MQERWLDLDDPVNDKAGDIELSRIMSADVRLDDAGFDIGIRDSWQQAPVGSGRLRQLGSRA